jgi:glutamine synthetase
MNIILEYIWIGGNNELRSKTKVIRTGQKYSSLDFNPVSGTFQNFTLPDWNFDGSSTGQTEGHDSEVILKPQRTYENPFLTGQHAYLVLCETYLPDGSPHPSNTRITAAKIFLKYFDHKAMFGIEHEFFVFDNDTGRPVGFPKNSQLNPAPQGPYYCSVGYRNTQIRAFMDEVLLKCLDTTVAITGYNLEVCPGQAEFQICAENMKAADDSVIFKYIVQRVGEDYKYNIDFSAKPVKGDWNGSGCHVNFSTKTMRAEDGYKEILNAIKKLEAKHMEHIEIYGSDNKDRLTGLHETSDINTFSYGVADRGCSIRIPRSTIENQCGYFEDRRPSSSADMYLVTSKLTETCLSN